MSKWFRITSAVALPILVAAGVALAADAPEPANAVAALSPCSDCHDVLGAEFAHNPHFRFASAANRNAKGTCEKCHGDGAKHIDAGGDPSLITIPRGAVGAKVCLSCHAHNGENSPQAHSAHSSASVNCTDCHKIHPSGVPQAALLQKPVGQLCVSCHAEQKAIFRKPFAHRLGNGGLECTSCHNPHGGHGEGNLKTTAGELPCLSCHTDKRGPFVFPHVTGVVGDCMTCHEPHGSTNPRRLIRARVDQLCLQCHTTLPTGLLGSQPPSFHDLRSPRYTNCTTCHIAVHGSNSSPLLLK
jgi:DmsE family decaheme c-type cytochrome